VANGSSKPVVAFDALAQEMRPEDIPVPDDSDDDLDDERAAACSDSAPVATTFGAGRLLCRVRDDVDVIGIAPTGSGKTLAFLLPLLADGLCAASPGVLSLEQLFCRFRELFPRSFPPESRGNLALLERCDQLHATGKVVALLTAMEQVAGKAEQARDEALAVQWRSLRFECALVDLVAPRAAVLLPTRELALQVADVAVRVGASCAVVIGGVDPAQQQRQLHDSAPGLLVATPGRLRALCGEQPASALQRRADAAAPATVPAASVALGAVMRLVMDEGDRLLDEGFSDDVCALARLAGRRKQAMLFSATWSAETESLAAVLRPAVAHIAVAGIPRTIVQDVEIVPKAARGRRLRDLLHEFGPSKVLVFVLFKREAKDLGRMLQAEGFGASVLQGDMSQSARNTALQRFRDASHAVLVATDVAARGLDVGGVSHVVNFSLGLSMDSYVHRIGRCGRAGRDGTAVTFVTDGDERHAMQLQRVLRQCGQPVPPGLTQMAAAFEKATAGGLAATSLKLKHSGARGEVRLVAKESQRADADQLALPQARVSGADARRLRGPRGVRLGG